MKAIQVWRWQDAPQNFRALSRHGGDEDWLALIPKELADLPIAWMDDGTPFGCCSVSSHTLKSGDIVRIGAHA